MRALVLSLLLLLTAGSAAMAGTIYFNDFEGAVGSEWSTATTTVTPAGCTHCTTFLGENINDSIVLTLSSLPTNTTITISFELFIIRSWDGSGENGWGPDNWTLAISDGSNWAYTFGNGTGMTQTYPVVGSAPGTGASEVNTLGYTFGDSARDMVYDLTFSWYNTTPTTTITFAASGLQGMSGYGYADESWGLDDFRASDTADIPEPATALLFGSGVLAFLLYRRRCR